MGISGTRSLPWRGEYVKGVGMSRVEVGMSRGVLTPPPTDMGYKVDTVGKQAVRIILECFFVFDMSSSAMRTVDVFHCGRYLLSFKSETNQIYCY